MSILSAWKRQGHEQRHFDEGEASTVLLPLTLMRTSDRNQPVVCWALAQLTESWPEVFLAVRARHVGAALARSRQ
eukprot:CAMPEP_0113838344 /NCGR_PEP_ID=MMETSP0328-20130328/10490_1 /TAXON_ID=39455 /ORGANISM="Alexandrium minutum" /LENGTH=74 /DNA_ID=CAMNT_0000806873 /DNA_START=43 /DNA_END=264 /DNA_ORIENTATION=- /assembly_acc=CAM_ASM_000350